MSSKIGRDTPLSGDLRMRSRDNHQVIFFETDDAGALFRFTDMYPRMYGEERWVSWLAHPRAELPPWAPLLIRKFAVRGEPALEKVVSGAPNAAGTSGVDFSEMRADFTRFPGKMSVREGVVRGPLVGATVEGNIDYVRDEVHLRGTFVPFYGLNNMFGRIQIVGLFLGGGNKEGLPSGSIMKRLARQVRHASQSMRSARSRLVCCANSSLRREHWIQISFRHRGEEIISV